MRGLSVVIPSKTPRNLMECLLAICGGYEKYELARPSTVQDDGIEVRTTRIPPCPDVIVVDDSSEADRVGVPNVCEHMAARRIDGIKPFIYSRNCNLGIQAAGDDDVILLNDDALLGTPGGFSAMQQASEEHPEYGIIAATCNNVGNTNQWPQTRGLREDPRMVCFVCVLIPRRTIDTVGLLDERYSDYGVEDDDYCHRVRNAGLKIGIFDGCYVDHGRLKSSFRGEPGTGGDFRPNLKRYIEKWGVDNRGCGKETSPFRELFA